MSENCFEGWGAGEVHCKICEGEHRILTNGPSEKSLEISLASQPGERQPLLLISRGQRLRMPLNILSYTVVGSSQGSHLLCIIPSPWVWRESVNMIGYWSCNYVTLYIRGLPQWFGKKKKICLQCRRHKRHWFNSWVWKIPWRRK